MKSKLFIFLLINVIFIKNNIFATGNAAIYACKHFKTINNLNVQKGQNPKTGALTFVAMQDEWDTDNPDEDMRYTAPKIIKKKGEKIDDFAYQTFEFKLIACDLVGGTKCEPNQQQVLAFKNYCQNTLGGTGNEEKDYFFLVGETECHFPTSCK